MVTTTFAPIAVPAPGTSCAKGDDKGEAVDEAQERARVREAMRAHVEAQRGSSRRVDVGGGGEC